MILLRVIRDKYKKMRFSPQYHFPSLMVNLERGLLFWQADL
jgi:hypothetical protein